MYVLEYLCNKNLPSSISHRAGKIDNFTLVRQRKFSNLTSLLKFYNECYRPITSLEDIMSSYKMEQTAHITEISDFYYN